MDILYKGKIVVNASFDGIFALDRNICILADIKYGDTVAVFTKKKSVTIKKIKSKKQRMASYYTRPLKNDSLFLKNKEWLGTIFIDYEIFKNKIKLLKRSNI